MTVPQDVDELDKADAIADIDYSLEHPRVVQTPERLERARDNAATTKWGQSIAERVRELAESVPQGVSALMIDTEPAPLVSMSADEIRALAPIGQDGKWYACYAAAFGSTPANLARRSITPIDGSRPRLAGVHRPGELVDGAGRTFPGTYDGVEITLDADGWRVPDHVPDDWAVSELEGSRLCLAAIYNGAVVRMLYACLEPLAYAYALTEEERYAETAAVAFDVLAAAGPGSAGILGRQQGYVPQSGWLHRSGYTAGRALRAMARAADLLWDSPAFERPPEAGMIEAATGEQQPPTAHATIRERVAEDLFVEGMHYLWEDCHGGAGDYEKTVYADLFNNGTADYCEGMLAAASLLGIETGYAAWTLDGQVSLEKFLANTTFRDGQYYETSGNYGNENFAPFARMAQTYRSSRYPSGYDAFDTDRYERVMLTGPARRQVAGRVPAYGDTTGGGDYPHFDADFEVQSGPPTGRWSWAFLFWCRASDERRQRAARTLADIADGDPMAEVLERAGEFSYSGADAGTRPLFFIDDGITDPADRDEDHPAVGDDLLPGKGMVLQRPDGRQDRGAFLRYGPTLNHGHADEFGLQFYGGGRELSFDPGRRPKLQLLTSWLQQTVTHNTVVVDETPSGLPENAGADVLAFADRRGYGYVEVTNDALYEDVDEYRRGVSFIDVGTESYLVDLFRVTGGEVRDYSFHGGGVGFTTDLDLSDPEPGSVASPDYWWGDKVTESGVLEGFEDEDRWLNAPPGNGYGFLGQPRQASGDEPWTATWTVEQEPSARVQLTMLGGDDRDIVVANAPEIMVEKLGHGPETADLQYTLARDRRSGPTQFASVIQPVGETFPVESVEPLPTTRTDGGGGTDRDPVAMCLPLQDGRTDYVLSAPDGEPFVAELHGGGTVTTDAGFAHLRIDGDELETLRIERGRRFELADLNGLTADIDLGPQHTGTIRDVHESDAALQIAGDLPADGTLGGRHVLVDGTDYGRSSPFAVANVEERTDGDATVTLEPTTFELGRGIVRKREGNVLVSPTEFPFVHTQPQYAPATPPNQTFDGKRITNRETGAESRIVDVHGDWNRIEVADASGFAAGDQFIVHEVKAGDRVAVPHSFELRGTADGFEYDVPPDATVDITTD